MLSGLAKFYLRFKSLLSDQAFEMKNLKLDLTQNNLICGDSKDWLPYIPDNSIDLIYIDPPFFSNKNYEIIWGNGFELRSFGDRWKGGIEHYIGWMRDKIIEAHRVLKPTGSIFLHCDYRANYRLRELLNEIFGEKNFKNEIIWAYRTGGTSQRFFARKHESIFFYSKSKKYKFNLQKQKSYLDDTFFKPHQPKSKSLGISEDENGMYRFVGCRDFWDDINNLHPRDSERVGYRTQKPEALINRIIKSVTNEEDTVLDFFGGGEPPQKWLMT